MRLLIPLVILALALDERDDLKNGRVALRRGDYATAERLLKSVAAARPDDWDVRTRLLETQTATGKLDDAEKTCRDFLFKHRDSAPAWAALSSVKLARGDAAGALDAAETALKSGADEPRAVVARARALAALGRRDDAAKALEGLSDLHKKRKDDFMKGPLVAIARGLVLRDELAGAPEDYKLAAERILPDILRADNDPAVRTLLAHAHISRRRPATAAPLLAEALGMNGSLADAHLGQGLLALEAGDFAAAVEAADRALAVNPSLVDAHALRVRAAWWKLDVDDARKRLDEAAKKFARDARLEALAAAVAEKPATPADHLELARFRAAQRRFADAATAFDAAKDAPRAAHAHWLAELKPLPWAADVASSDALVTDLAKTWDALAKEHAAIRVAGADVRVPKRALRWMEPWVRALVEEAWPALTKHHGGAPESVLVVFCEKPESLAAIATGVPGAAGGGALGRVVALPMPQPASSWAAMLWAGLAQAFELHRAGPSTLPRWHLPGVGGWAAKRAGFDVADELAILTARRDGKIAGPADVPALAAEFLDGKLPTAMDDKAFLAWLDARLAKSRYVLPPRPDDRRIVDADSDPKDAAKAVVAAHDALAQKKYERAIKYARQAIAADAKSAAAHSLLGQALQKRRKHDEAYESLKEATKLGADDYRTWYAMGDCLEDLGDDPKSAIEAFGRAKAAFPRLVADPEGAESAYRRLIRLHQRAKDAEAEMRELAAAVALEPLNVRDRKRLLKHVEKDADRVIALVTEMARVQPEDKSLYSSLGAALASKKEIEKAIETRMIAVALIEAGVGEETDAEKATEFCELATLHLAAGRKDKAREFAKEALRAVPGHERAQKLYEEATR